jgi:hypothetical protein
MGDKSEASKMNTLDVAQGDSLDDILGVRGDAMKTPAIPPENYKPRDFSEPCPKCRGTGRFTGWSGRVLGQCFVCKGAGKRTFKTAPEKRQQAKVAAVARKERTEAEALETFKAEYADVWQWMEGNSFEFAVSLRQSLQKFGSLTENQINAARNAIAKRDAAREAANERKANAPEINMDKIEAAFATARANGLKKIKVRFVGLSFSPAKAESANAGALYVKEGSEYLGKIMGGRFMASRDCGAERAAKVVEIARDPKAAAIAHGKLTGSCSCCGRELTDPVSVEAGIGPICATKFGW